MTVRYIGLMTQRAVEKEPNLQRGALHVRDRARENRTINAVNTLLVRITLATAPRDSHEE